MYKLKSISKIYDGLSELPNIKTTEEIYHGRIFLEDVFSFASGKCFIWVRI